MHVLLSPAYGPSNGETLLPAPRPDTGHAFRLALHQLTVGNVANDGSDHAAQTEEEGKMKQDPPPDEAILGDEPSDSGSVDHIVVIAGPDARKAEASETVLMPEMALATPTNSAAVTMVAEAADFPVTRMMRTDDRVSEASGYNAESLAAPRNGSSFPAHSNAKAGMFGPHALGLHMVPVSDQTTKPASEEMQSEHDPLRPADSLRPDLSVADRPSGQSDYKPRVAADSRMTAVEPAETGLRPAAKHAATGEASPVPTIIRADVLMHPDRPLSAPPPVRRADMPVHAIHFVAAADLSALIEDAALQASLSPVQISVAPYRPFPGEMTWASTTGEGNQGPFADKGAEPAIPEHVGWSEAGRIEPSAVAAIHSPSSTEVSAPALGASVHFVRADSGPVPGDLTQTSSFSSGSDEPASVDHVAHQTTMAVRALGAGVTEIRLDPPELGRLRLDLRTDGRAALLVIAVEHQHTFELVRGGLPGLAVELRGLGYDRVEIVFDSDQQNGQRGEANSHPGSQDPASDRPGTGDVDGQGQTARATFDEQRPPGDAPAATLHPLPGTGLDLRL